MKTTEVEKEIDMNLVREIEKFMYHLELRENTPPFPDEYIDDTTFYKIARHFFELGQKDAANKYDEVEYNRQRAEEEMLGKTLDEAAEKYVREGHLLPEEFLVIPAFKAGAKWQEEKDKEIIKLAEDHAFLAGADWQKEQIMKGAVDGVVIYHDHPEYKYILVPYEEFNNGDKVHLIVLKTEEESK